MVTTYSAPGKIILIGEHAVVHGYPAVITPIGLRSYTSITGFDDGRIKIKAKNLSLNETYSIDDLNKYYDDVSESLKWFREGHNPNILSELKSDRAILPKVLIIEFLRFFDLKGIGGFSINHYSDILTGGMGASSAGGASLIRALGGYFNIDLKDKDIISILINGENMLHGNVSGADQTAVVKEKLIKFRRSPEGNTLEEIHHSKLLSRFLIIDSGRPVNTTGEVVAEVNKFMEQQPQSVKKIFESIENLTVRLLKAMSGNLEDEFRTVVENVEFELVKLGIVRPKTQNLIEKINQLGGSAKVSGAGAISGSGSGAVICFAKDYDPIIKFLNENKIQFFDTGIDIKH